MISTFQTKLWFSLATSLALYFTDVKETIYAQDEGNLIFITCGISRTTTSPEGGLESWRWPSYGSGWFKFDTSTRAITFWGYRREETNKRNWRAIIFRYISGNGSPPQVITEVPFVSRDPFYADTLVLHEIRSDGSVEIMIRGKKLSLGAGESYSVFHSVKKQKGNGRLKGESLNRRIALLFTDSLKVKNYGWCPRNLVSFKGW